MGNGNKSPFKRVIKHSSATEGGQIMHIGCDFIFDALGAWDADMRCAWLNPSMEAVPPENLDERGRDSNTDAILFGPSGMLQLDEVLERLQAARLQHGSRGLLPFDL